MDPFIHAATKAYVIQQRATSACSTTSASSAGSRQAGYASSGRSYERAELVKHQRMRGHLNFMERMDVDANSRKADKEVSQLMSRDPSASQVLGRMVASQRPVQQAKEPKIAKSGGKLLYEGHDRKQQWAPLEYY